MTDSIYTDYRFTPAELSHRYGERVHLLADPVAITQLARLCEPSCTQPEVTHLMRGLYEQLLRVAAGALLPRTLAEVPTRMAEHTPKGVFVGDVIDRRTRAVTVDLARAGMVPSQVAFEFLSGMLDPQGVRQDHIFINRTTDDAGAVTGVAVSGNKIGGDMAGRYVFIPDPMGATGGSICQAATMLKEWKGGAPTAIAALHLVVTPEYIGRLREEHPDVHVFALRLDRGLSPEDVLASEPGARFEEERGLNDHQYIVPGAGGLGEVMNNSYV